jgi:glycosyltransferase involved in cell wall biosynthesis
MSRPLRIAQVASVFATVPPKTYGGTERIVHWLTETLVERGHEVTLFAAAGSQTGANLRITREETLYQTWEREPWRGELAQISSVVDALRASTQFDLVHFHMGALSVPFSGIATVPTVHSLPSPLYPDDAATLLRYPEASVTARSHRQVEDLPDWRRTGVHVVPNGCDFDRFTPPDGPGRYLVYLGRMAEEKNPLDAIRLAHRVAMPIVLAGMPVEPRDHEYFDAEIRPLIDGKDVTYIGPVDDPAKNDLLHDAAAFVFPIQWEEAFGIVMIEAMACGVPVLACEYGSVPEVVDFGVTGFYADSAEELTEFVPKALALNRGEIRRHARGRFSREVMTDAYLKVYESGIAGFQGPGRDQCGRS